VPVSPVLKVAAPDPAHHALVRALAEALDPSALLWASGYLAGVAAARDPAHAGLPTSTPAAAPAALRLTIVHGSQTGNARRLAERSAEQARAAGVDVRVVAAGKYARNELADERLLLVVISTQGDGDPPDDALAFCEHVLGKRAPSLPELRYAVLGLGDSSYPKFCETARVLDQRFAALGAQRVMALAELDLDFDTTAPPWIARATQAWRDIAGDAVLPRATVTPLRAPPAAYGRDNPFGAEVLVNQRITSRDADKDVRHVELSLAGSGLHYEAGDSLGIVPRNPAFIVDAVLAAARLDGAESVTHGGVTRPLAQWLGEAREITKLSRPVVATHAARAAAPALNRLLAPEGQPQLAALFATYQLVDLLSAFPADWTGEELVAALRPLTPRLYSLASSPHAVGDEAHLTVAVVDYDLHGARHLGAGSGHLAFDLAEGERARVFIETNERFRLPADAARDLIMIGAGTGVAPYRAFLQTREATGATGRHWLVFGEQRRDSTFLYQTEWLAARERGTLHRLDLAFSRDQAQKIYVQQRLCENGADVYAWIEQGATLYVCGDAQRLAPDVHRTLIDIVATHGGRSIEQATEYIAALAGDQRYLRDVY
jgi:sulfite reductase (NADPH) flavoprotein alpha-component